MTRENIRKMLEIAIIEELFKRGIRPQEAENHLSAMISSGEIGRRTDLVFNALKPDEQPKN